MKTKQKVFSLAPLKRKLANFRRQGKTIAFTNGCFDILHYGHVSYLESAKKANRILVVGLNSDVSVKKIKGPGRPIIHQKYRALLLAALTCVDFVIIFNESTPQKLIAALKPDVLIKGADWKGKKVAGSEIVARVEFIKFIPNLSTSNIIEAMKKRA